MTFWIAVSLDALLKTTQFSLLLLCWMSIARSRDSSVGIATVCGLDDEGELEFESR
jgi:hypothetical protein